MLINELLKEDLSKTKGTIRIILGAHPFAMATNTRESPLDGKDLNRVMPGSKEGTPTEQLAHTLLKFLEESDMVLDLHNFDIETPLMGILVEGSPEQTQKNKKLMQCLRPQIVWKLKPKREHETRFQGSLGQALNDKGVANIVLEVEHPHRLRHEQVTQGVQCLMQFLKEEMGEESPMFIRERILSEHEGIFTPERTLFDEVEEGDTLGKLTIIPTMHEITITSPKKGTVIQQRHGAVKIGQELGAVGERT